MPRKATLSCHRKSYVDVPLHGTLVPSRISVQSLGLDGEPDLFAEFEISDGAAVCRSISYQSQPGGRPVSTDDVREIADLTRYGEDAFLRYSRNIADFRANAGRLHGEFEGAPLLLLHHHDQDSGSEYVAIMFYLASDDPDVVHVFATRAGLLENPTWYRNIVASGAAAIELGTDWYRVGVRELHDAERDRVWGEQVRRYPGFGEYERLNAGLRLIPVIELSRLPAAGDG